MFAEKVKHSFLKSYHHLLILAKQMFLFIHLWLIKLNITKSKPIIFHPNSPSFSELSMEPNQKTLGLLFFTSLCPIYHFVSATSQVLIFLTFSSSSSLNWSPHIQSTLLQSILNLPPGLLLSL